MKKITAIICTMAMLAALTACDNKETPGSVPESTNSASESTGGSESGSPQSTPDGASSESGGSESTPESSTSEESAPKGEPTFLTCVDGTVVNTSDITQIQGMVYDINNELEQFKIEDFDKQRFLDGDYSVACDGFAYAFTSKHSFNPVQNPDLFERFEDSDMVEYIGDEIAPSSEYYRVEPGDKFGELTVKSAETGFYSNYADYDERISGAYTYSGMIEFDGELELTGYIQVSRPNEGYDEGGEIRFVPDNEFVDKIPIIKYSVNEEKNVVEHSPMSNCDSNAYNDFNRFSLGNLHDYDIDLDGLEEGERFTHVKITIGDIVSMGLTYFADIDAKLLSLEKI